MRIKLFTHTDLDGTGCAILATLAFGDDVNIWFSDYADINKDVTEFIASDIDDYDEVFITDISVNEDVAALIQKLYSDKVTLIDHHGSAEWLNKYDWATVHEVDDGEHVCGTSLFYDMLTFNDYIPAEKDSKDLQTLVEAIRRYDTWEWKTKYNEERPNRLNTLLRTIGRQRFVKRFVAAQVFFTKEDSDILNVVEDMKARYIKTALYTMTQKQVIIDKTPYIAGIIFAEDHISEIGNMACEQNSDIDFCVIINMQQGAVSYRCTREDLDLGKQVAALYGGGGHPKTAGSQIDSFKLNEVIETILRRP